VGQRYLRNWEGMPLQRFRQPALLLSSNLLQSTRPRGILLPCQRYGLLLPGCAPPRAPEWVPLSYRQGGGLTRGNSGGYRGQMLGPVTSKSVARTPPTIIRRASRNASSGEGHRQLDLSRQSYLPFPTLN
jgi:hypothetical protein